MRRLSVTTKFRTHALFRQPPKLRGRRCEARHFRDLQGPVSGGIGAIGGRAILKLPASLDCRAIGVFFRAWGSLF